MATKPYSVRGRDADPSLMDDLDVMLDELYAEVDSIGSAEHTHTMLSDTHTDTVEATVARGDLITGQIIGTSSTVAWQQKALGTSGHFVKSDGTDVVYAAIQETDITDGSLLARVASNETITGSWTFDADLLLASGRYVRLSGGPRIISATATDVRLGDPAANTNSTISFYAVLSQRMQISSSAITAANSAVFRSTDGTASAPAFSHTTDTNTGMYFNNSDALLWSTGGTERMRLTSTGLGIGVTATVKLDVKEAGIATTSTIGARLVNDTAATSGTTRQFSPALAFSGTGWDTDAGGSSKTVRGRLDLRPTTGTNVNSGLYFAFDEDGAGTFTDEFLAGRAIAGETPRFAIRDGNIVFRNAGRGIYFTTAPMTDTLPATHYMSGNSNGRIDLIPLTGGSDGFVNIEQSQFGTATGTIPTVNLRTFDNSTSSPTLGIRYRAVPGGTAAAGFGTRDLWQASSNTTSNQDQGAFDCVWSDATHATRTADFVMYLVSSAAALTEKFRFKASGELLLIAAGIVTYTGRSKITSPADSQVLLTDNAGTAFARLMFGGTSSSFPALKRNSAVLETKLADDSAYAQHKALEFSGSSATYLMRTSVAWNNGAAAAAGTLTNAPTAGDPTKWIPVDDNGTTRYIPAW